MEGRRQYREEQKSHETMGCVLRRKKRKLAEWEKRELKEKRCFEEREKKTGRIDAARRDVLKQSPLTGPKRKKNGRYCSMLFEAVNEHETHLSPGDICAFQAERCHATLTITRRMAPWFDKRATTRLKQNGTITMIKIENRSDVLAPKFSEIFRNRKEIGADNYYSPQGTAMTRENKSTALTVRFALPRSPQRNTNWSRSRGEDKTTQEEADLNCSS